MTPLSIFLVHWEAILDFRILSYTKDYYSRIPSSQTRDLAKRESQDEGCITSPPGLRDARCEETKNGYFDFKQFKHFVHVQTFSSRVSMVYGGYCQTLRQPATCTIPSRRRHRA